MRPVVVVSTDLSHHSPHGEGTDDRRAHRAADVAAGSRADPTTPTCAAPTTLRGMLLAARRRLLTAEHRRPAQFGRHGRSPGAESSATAPSCSAEIGVGFRRIATRWPSARLHAAGKLWGWRPRRRVQGSCLLDKERRWCRERQGPAVSKRLHDAATESAGRVRYVALLRGIGPLNPSMRNENLRRVFENLGFLKRRDGDFERQCRVRCRSAGCQLVGGSHRGGLAGAARLPEHHDRPQCTRCRTSLRKNPFGDRGTRRLRVSRSRS